MTASVIDELRILCYTYISAHTPKSKKPRKPKLVQRPGATVVKQKKVRMSLAEMRKQLQRSDWVDAGAEAVKAD